MSNNSSKKSPGELWRRLWVPLSRWDAIGAGGGFLFSGLWSGIPDQADAVNPRPLETWNDSPFRILLGRPGAGKSTEMVRVAAGGILVEANVVFGGDIKRHLDEVLADVTGAGLFLDGLDELLIANPGAIPQLRDWLKRHPSSVGHLSIAIRWASWIDHKEALEEMASRLDRPAPEVLVLCPLERSVAETASFQSLGENRAQEFWRAIRSAHAEAVACWPQSFQEMLLQFEDDDTLGGSPSRLLKNTVLRRCRAADGLTDVRNRSLDQDWNFRVAGRLAAAMIFTGRQELSLATSCAGKECLSADDLGNFPETWDHQRKVVKDADLHALVRTQLLRPGSGDDRFVFEHQLYVECLAAHWLTAQNLSVPKLAALTGANTDHGWRCVPRFQPLAAWLARDNADYRQWLLEHDPLTLLRLDAEEVPELDRMDVVEAILKRTAEIKTLDPAFRHAHLGSLRHPAVNTQLERWLRDFSAPDAAKELALEMGTEMKLMDLGDTLWEIWETSSPHLRTRIARALLHLSGESHFEKWEAILRGYGPEFDPDGNLLGAALQVMVPERIPLIEVLHWIVPERNFGIIALYSSWAWSAAKNLVEDVSGSELAAILRRLGLYFAGQSPGNVAARKLTAKAVPMAFKRINEAEILAALVDYWYECRERYAAPLDFEGEDDDSMALDEESIISKSRWDIPDLQARRQFIYALISDPRFERHRDHWFIEREDVPLGVGQFSWLLEQLLAAGESHRWRWAILAGFFIHVEAERDGVDALLERAVSTSPELRKLLPEMLPGEGVDEAIRRSERERTERVEAQHATRNAGFEQTRIARRKEVDTYTKSARQEHEKGGIVWHDVFSILDARQLDDRDGGRRSELDTLSYIGDDEAWMKDAARRFLIEFSMQEAFPKDDGYFGVMAISLLLDELEADADLRRAVGSHWLPHVFYVLAFHGLGKRPSKLSAEQFIDWFPAEAPAAFGAAMRSCYPAGNCIQLGAGFESRWHAGVDCVLEEMLLLEPVQPKGFCGVVRFLRRHSALPIARKVVRHQLAHDETRSDPEKYAAVLAAAFFQLEGSIWPEIRDLIEKNTELIGKMIAASTETLWYDCDRREPHDFATWPLDSLEGFVKVLDKTCPGVRWERGRRGMWSESAPAFDVRELRDLARQNAAERGRFIPASTVNPAQSEEDHAGAERADQYYRHSAGRHQLEKAWKPLHPAEFLKAATTLDARLARTPGELLEAVKDCLRDYEPALTTQERYKNIWDIKNPEPRDELDVAKDVKQWLDEKLCLAVNREVQLADNGRPDILVQATWPDRRNPVTVVIELKRDCHAELATAMESQLRERYLVPHLDEGWTHGIYLVAWMPKPETKRSAEAALGTVRGRLNQQAGELSRDGVQITAMVLDARWPSKTTPVHRKRSGKVIKR
jgi:hypothetical protein